MKKFRLSNDQLLVDESLFSVANGYIGIRGNFEEGYAPGMDSIRGSYINGVYEIIDLTYAESAHGFPMTAQKLLNIMDAQTINLYIDEERFSLFEGTIVDMKRELNINEGYATRHIEWISPKGHHLVIDIKRMASFAQLELYINEYTVQLLSGKCIVRFESVLNSDVENYTGKKTGIHDPRVASGHGKLLYFQDASMVKETIDFKIRSITQHTTAAKRSQIQVTATMFHNLPLQYRIDESQTIGIYEDKLDADTLDADKDKLKLLTYVIYTDSRRHADTVIEGLRLMKKVIAKPVKSFFDAQKANLDEFWRYARVDVKEKPTTEESLTEESVNFNIYQLIASAGKDSLSNVSAKGLSGEGYEGHYFWDTEIYILPLFILCQPKSAENLLSFRYETLDASRERALQMGHAKGAKVPWRTINGQECSGFFPAGCAQYHINADVAYSYIQYFLVTGDINFIESKGFEVLLETARIWLEIGHFEKGQFRIDDVTGPDEYTAIVNNNYYTNAMAKYHLRYVGVFYDLFLNKVGTDNEKETNSRNELVSSKETFSQLLERLQVTAEEIAVMRKAGENMYLPFDKELDVCLQDDSFVHKAEWDFDGTPRENYPLLLHYHPLTIYRYKVLKQADTILAHLLLDNQTESVFVNTFNYYEKRTTHDSSLSPCVHGIMASRIGNTDKAYQYFMKTLRLDLDNLHHNTKDGLHIANAGGVYMSMVYGFGGLRIKDDGIHLNPSIPKEWESFTFRLNLKDNLVTITVGETVIIKSDGKVDLFVNNTKYLVDGVLEVKYKNKAQE